MAPDPGPADTGTTPAASAPSAARSRRAILAAGLGGLAASLAAALGRPLPTRAAAGDPMILGQANSSGMAQTSLTNAGTGAAFTLKTTNTVTGGTGIFGWSSQTGTGVTRGVYGKADGPNANAVVGVQNGVAGAGAAVYADGGNNVGVLATSDTQTAISGTSPDYFGVVGMSTTYTGVRGASTSGTGVHASSASGIGVYASSDSNYGVRGSSSSSYGVYASSTSGTGVRGDSTGAIGVHGSSTSSIGVYGVSDSSIGVYGASTGTWAGYFDGDTNVAGTLVKTAGSFRIDHPLDPAGKYLSHSFVESPDMLNVYNGNATLDANGAALVSLPAWFEALNRDFRYQLTPIGAHAPLYVKTKVKNNRFAIGGGSAGTEVSWQVTGVRQDAYANAHRIKVEEAKTGEARGRYLHPELFGKPATMSVQPRPEISATPAG